MTDIFDTTILCKQCDTTMHKTHVVKQGAHLRAIQCPTCNDTIVHPADQSYLAQYNQLKNKTYNVKLRVVGNSHAVSIPKEIISFIKEQERVMDTMVRMHLEDMHKVTIYFRSEDNARTS